MKRIGKTLALQEVYEFVSETQQLQLQRLKKRFYRDFAPAVINPLRVFTLKGFKLLENAPYGQMFSQTRLVWEDFYVKEIGETNEDRLAFFEGKYQDAPTMSMIVQTKDSEVCLIGGKCPSLLTHEYDVARSCLLIDLVGGILAEKS